MKRPCDVCGTEYEAKRVTSKYCSTRCRTRRSRGAEVLPLSSADAETSSDQIGSGPTVSATFSALQAAGRLDTPLGAAALALAHRVDSPGADTGSALAAVVRQLESTLSTALRGAGSVSAPGQLQDELAARRAAHGA